MKRVVAFLLAGLAATIADGQDKVDFATQIKPIFAEHCDNCHGEQVAKGDLQLHSVATIDEFGAGYLFSPEVPEESALLTRITLPPDDEMMMPKGGQPLPEETIELIRRWIGQGAEMGEAETPTEQPPADDLPEVEPASEEAIARLEEAGAQVLPLFHGSPLLRVTFAYANQPAGDQQVALLADVAPQVLWLNLARSEVTNAGTAPLATLQNLRHLHLEQSAIGDDALMHLQGLNDLEYLNLYDTQVTDAGLKHLQGLKNLKRLYLWQTPVTFDAAMALQESVEGLQANLGWNHPEVARRRLTQELERVTAQKEDAIAQIEQAQQQQEAAAEREKQIQKELGELEGEPAEETEAENAESAEDDAEDEPAAEEPAAADKETADDKASDDEQ